MTEAQKKRIARLNKIALKMGGRLDGHNIDNYKRIAKITSSSVSTVKSWFMKNASQRVIPQSKLDLLIAKI